MSLKYPNLFIRVLSSRRFLFWSHTLCASEEYSLKLKAAEKKEEEERERGGEEEVEEEKAKGKRKRNECIEGVWK
jgi:hypothetical protein